MRPQLNPTLMAQLRHAKETEQLARQSIAQETKKRAIVQGIIRSMRIRNPIIIRSLLQDPSISSALIYKMVGNGQLQTMRRMRQLDIARRVGNNKTKKKK